MRFLAAVSLFALTAPLCVAQNFAADTPAGPTSTPQKPAIFDTTAIDKSVDPCTDFYKYSCGNWDKANPIPADRTAYGRFTELADYNNYLLYSELKQASEAPKTPLQKKYGDYFASCMDLDTINKLGAKPLQPELDAIASISDPKGLAAYNAKQDRRNGGAFFGVGVTQDQKDASKQVLATGQGGLTLPDRDYYLNESPRFAKLRT